MNYVTSYITMARNSLIMVQDRHNNDNNNNVQLDTKEDLKINCARVEQAILAHPAHR